MRRRAEVGYGSGEFRQHVTYNRPAPRLTIRAGDREQLIFGCRSLITGWVLLQVGGQGLNGRCMVGCQFCRGSDFVWSFLKARESL